MSTVFEKISAGREYANDLGITEDGPWRQAADDFIAGARWAESRQSVPVTAEEVAEPKITVHYYEHSCEWLTKYCDEHHRRTALVPVSVLARFVITHKPTETEEP